MGSLFMYAFAQKQTRVHPMSAIPPKADIAKPTSKPASMRLVRLVLSKVEMVRIRLCRRP
jgi:hypothetical protein